MSVQPKEDPGLDELYCDPMDVASYFDKYDAFDAASNPSEREVIRRIQGESEWVDSYTGHAWRERRVVNEYKSLGDIGNSSTTYYWRAGSPLKLMKRNIRTPLDSSKGDKIEVWEGDGYEDWVADPNEVEGREEDYWVEESTGMLYIYRRRLFFNRHKEVRVTYRYGKESVPPLIRDAVARRVAAHFLESQQYRITVPGNEEAPDQMTVAERWRETAEEDLQRYKEIRTIGNQ